MIIIFLVQYKKKQHTYTQNILDKQKRMNNRAGARDRKMKKLKGK